MDSLYTVDAFGHRPFEGNPAGVCVLTKPAPEAWMQSLAAEMRHSETAFLVPDKEAWSLRWFTPAAEVDLCGHATLASAHVLFSTGRVPKGSEARFDTRSGRLTCRPDGDRIAMDFPALAAASADPPEGLLEALGVTAPRAVALSRFDYLVEVERESEVRALTPDFVRLKSLQARGVMVTARSSQTAGCDFVSRFFAPGVGVDEDPVTGSAHCVLAPWWAQRLGRRELTGFQASARGGFVGMRLSEERVTLSGHAVTVWSGRMRGGPGLL